MVVLSSRPCGLSLCLTDLQHNNTPTNTPHHNTHHTDIDLLALLPPRHQPHLLHLPSPLPRFLIKDSGCLWGPVPLTSSSSSSAVYITPDVALALWAAIQRQLLSSPPFYSAPLLRLRTTGLISLRALASSVNMDIKATAAGVLALKALGLAASFVPPPPVSPQNEEAEGQHEEKEEEEEEETVFLPSVPLDWTTPPTIEKEQEEEEVDHATLLSPPLCYYELLGLPPLPPSHTSTTAVFRPERHLLAALLTQLITPPAAPVLLGFALSHDEGGGGGEGHGVAGALWFVAPGVVEVPLVAAGGRDGE